MTINVSASWVRYHGDGATTGFPFAFRALAKSHLTVIVTDANGVATTVDPANFSVAGTFPMTGGTVTYGSGSPLAVGSTLDVVRVVPLTQPADLINQDAFYPDTLEGAFDYLVMQNQQQQEILSRAITAPRGETGFSVPATAARKGLLALWDGVTGALGYMTQAAAVALFKGDPGGNVMAVGLFTALAGLSIPVGTDRVQTSGYASKGFGAAAYAVVADNDTAAAGLGLATSNIVARSANGRWFKVDETFLKASQAGAPGDNASDATTALQAAADSGALVVLVDGGKTYVSATVNISASNQNWIIGPGTTVKLKNGTNGKLFNVTGAHVTISGAGVIDGNRANQTRENWGGHLVGASGADYFRVLGGQGLQVNNAAGCAVYAANCSHVSIKDVGITSPDLAGVFVEATGTNTVVDVEIQDNRIDRSAGVGSTYQPGIAVQQGNTASLTDWKVAGNRTVLPITSIVSGAIGIYVRGAVGVAYGNRTFGGYMGMSIDSAHAVAITGNVLSGFTNYGLELPGSSANTATGNVITGPGTGTGAWGVIMDGASTTTPDNVLAANNISNVDYGVGSSGNTSALGAVVTANRIKFGIAGIYMTSGDELVAAANRLDGPGTGDCVFLNNSDKAVVIGNAVANADTLVNCYAPSASTQTHTTVTGNQNHAVNNLIAVTGSRTFGSSNLARGNTHHADYVDVVGGVRVLFGTGAPNGFYSAGVGSLFFRTDGGASTSLYVKESGTGNTGWVAK